LAGEIDGVQVHWGAYIERQSSFFPMARIRKRYLMYKTCRHLLHQGLDWLILYDIGIEGLPFLLLARQAGCRVAADNCDMPFISKQKSLKDLFRLTWDRLGHLLVTPYLNLNFVISAYLEKYLQQITPHVPRVRVLAPVDMRKFQQRPEAAEAFRKKYGLHKEQVIGYFGSIWKVKGLDVLLQAARELLTLHEPFKLLVSGNADKNPYFIGRIEELNLKDHVILTGFLSTDSLITAMSAADILVEPKIDDEENQAAFPQKLAEYLAMGKPIVASAIGDIPEFLHDQYDALLCRPGDPDSLATALRQLLTDDELCEKFSCNARLTAQRHFDCHLIAKDIEKALLNHL
jgi:glycosyltransferase involved in cell wall biosynthesis